jgi:hypothetical protein
VGFNRRYVRSGRYDEVWEFFVLIVISRSDPTPPVKIPVLKYLWHSVDFTCLDEAADSIVIGLARGRKNRCR